MKLQIKGHTKQYRVDWTEEDKYGRVFLRIRNITSIKNVRSEIITLSRENITYNPIQIDKTTNPCWQKMPELGNATYCFELYEDKEGKSAVLEAETGYVGDTQCLIKSSSSGKGGFVTLKISCRYKIPRELFWLSFKESVIKGKFFLPPMEREGDQFTTSCLVRENSYERLMVFVDGDVEDYLRVEQ